ncbi:MAG: class I SAM-dependent methyltransferase [Dehalococcoidia bacterium]
MRRELTKTEAAWLARLQGRVTAEEGERLAYLAAGVTEGVIVEIGSYRGKSTCYLAAGSRRGISAPVFAVDLWEQNESPYWSDPAHREKFNEQTARYGDLITAVPGDASDIVQGWEQPIGLLFVDGRHTYTAAERDIREWGAFIVPGGVIAVDDCDKPKVARAIRAHAAEYEGWEQVGKLVTAVRRV